MLEVIKFINNNSKWREILKEEPYYLQMVDDGQYTILKYNQIKSDFHNPIVKECRGLIIDNQNNQAVCVPFFKFGNYGESYADEIDWLNAKVQEKVDGSLIKCWYHNNEWHVSTNGTINAENAELQANASSYKNFGQLFYKAWSQYHDNFSCLNPQYTYMFELISPYNRVVIPYIDIDIRHIGTRDMATLKELDVDVGVPKPNSYSLCSLEDCIKACEKMSYSEEGYVVVDKNWHRIKVKSPAYVAVHHMINNGVITKERIVELIKTGEDGEFLTYYPQYAEAFISIKNKIEVFIMKGNLAWDNIKTKSYPSRKDLALEIQNNCSFCPPIFFALYDKRADNVKEWVYNQNNDKILKWIGEE